MAITDVELTTEDRTGLLQEWAARGPRGPFDADDKWPDERR